MSDPTPAANRDGADRFEAPPDGCCANCGQRLTDRFGWCGNCRVALCLACGRKHFCTPTCAAAGCLAGLCVRLVVNGRLATTWGLPDDA